MKHCGAHCSGCGSHFSSTGAFDLHRSGPWDGTRVCWAEDNERAKRLRPATRSGVCDVYAETSNDITIWEDGTAVDRARDTFHGSGGIPSSGAT